MKRSSQGFNFVVRGNVAMKRLVVRISALATVVVLGLISIVQAQRGAEDPFLEAKTSNMHVSGSSGEAVPTPIAALADAGDVPRSFRGGGNPLRPGGRQAVNKEITPVAATSGETYPAGSDFAGHSGAAASVPTGSYSPLNLAGAHIAASSAPDGLAAPIGARAARSIPDIISSAAPETETTGNPQLVSPTEADTLPQAEAGEATPSAAVGDRYAGQSSAAAGGEPAPFQLDPDSPSTSIPDAPTGLGDDFLPSITDSALGQHNAAEAGAVGEGTGTPGARQLEGAQTPQLTIEKSAPVEIQVGKAAKFHVTVRNTGQIAAQGVEIHDEIPKGTRLINTTPRASRGVRGELVWSVGMMKPGDEMSAEIELMPVEEGEIGSVATVHFTASASARTTATKPELLVETSAPNQVLIGEELTLMIRISNPGSGVATGVVLQERVPPGLRYSDGSELEYEVGSLKPNESRELQLVLVADRPGVVTNVLSAHGDGNLKADDRIQIEVVAPQLDVAVEGPARRYLEREATYSLSISNPGTAPAQDVSLIAHLPPGLKFVSANNAGHYNEASRTVLWQLEELPVQETGTVMLTTMSVEAGQQTLRVSGKTGTGLLTEQEQPVLIEGIAAILFEVVDVEDPVEVGGETTYEIRVLNQGSKAAMNVEVGVLLPPEMQPVAAEGPPGIRQAVEGSAVRFDALSRLAPKADTTYRVRARCLRPGDLRVRVQLTTDEIRTPVTKEESTMVYSDE